MEATLEHKTRPELVEWRKQDSAIAEMREKYLPLRIDGLDDRDGFKAVHDARMIVKNTRIAVEKKRVELKADALAYGKAVDAEAKRLTAMLEPIESHLQAEEDAVIAERDRIKREAEEAKRLALQKRLDALLECGIVGNPEATAAMSDEQFAANLATVKAAFEVRIKAETEAAEKRKAEEAALAAERARLEEIQRQQKAEADRLAAEQRRLDDERLARERAAELEKAKAEAAEKARADAERRHAEEIERVKRDAEAKAAREKAEAEEKVRREKKEAEAREVARIKAEAERPQREKILAVAAQIESMTVPVGPGNVAVMNVLVDAASKIRDIANGPLS